MRIRSRLPFLYCPCGQVQLLSCQVVIGNRRVLHVNGQRKDYFSLPGGKARRDEPIMSAAARELREEKGLVASRAERHLDWEHTCDAQQRYSMCSAETSGKACPQEYRFKREPLVGQGWEDRFKSMWRT